MQELDSKSAPENIYLTTLQVSQSTESLIPALHLEFFQGVLKLSGCSSMKFIHSGRSVQFSCSVLSNSATSWTAARQASLSITNCWSLPKLKSIESVMPSNHHPLSSPSPTFNLSQHQGLFQWLSSSQQVAKEFQLQHQSFQWRFRTDFL